MLTRDEIGGRAAREIGAGMVVNLGIGMPAPAASSIRPGPSAVIDVTPAEFALVEVAPGVDVEEVGAAPAIEGGRV